MGKKGKTGWRRGKEASASEKRTHNLDPKEKPGT